MMVAERKALVKFVFSNLMVLRGTNSDKTLTVQPYMTIWAILFHSAATVLFLPLGLGIVILVLSPILGWYAYINILMVLGKSLVKTFADITLVKLLVTPFRSVRMALPLRLVRMVMISITMIVVRFVFIKLVTSLFVCINDCMILFMPLSPLISPAFPLVRFKLFPH